MDLTKEIFETGLANLTEHVDARMDTLDSRMDTLDAKIDKIDKKIDQRTEELKEYTNQAFETQQLWMEERFKELIETSELRRQVIHIQDVMKQVAAKVGVDYQV